MIAGGAFLVNPKRHQKADGLAPQVLHLLVRGLLRLGGKARDLSGPVEV
jgi:hypothetical protein